MSRVRAALFSAATLLAVFAGTAQAQTPVVQINAGGGAVSPFAADTYFDTGSSYSSTAAINTSGVTNPAPAAVYQSVRWNSAFTYTIPGLTVGNSYLVRLHFVELTWTAAGQRLFNVAINGTNVLSNFDIYAAVGQNHALVREFKATANSSGQIVIAFTQGTADNPSVAGIEVDVPASTTRSPYGGSNWPVSNGSTIQAENYDLGGEGVAYHDTDAANNGGQYRTDGVDVETCADTGGGYDVGWINDGEWLDYTVNTTAANYNIVIRGASNASPANGSVKVLLDGVVVGQVSIPNTGGWQNWQDFTISNVAIAAGTGRTLQLQFVGGGFNVNSVRFATVSGGRSPYGGTNWSMANGTTIQAENYDNGGEGVAYHDTDAANQGGQYRTTEGVDVEACADTGGGYDVGWINDGEWLDYTVDATAGTYNIVIRGASLNNPSNGVVKVLLDGTVLGQVNVAYTGGWQTWQDFTIPNVSIAAGTGRTLQLAIVGGGFNINSVRFATSGGTPPPTPAGFTASGNNGSVSLSWSSSTGATSYSLYRSTTSNGEGTTAYASNLTTTSYTDPGVTNGTTYYYTVAAVNSAGTSAPSTEASATPSGGGGGTPNTPVIQINAGGSAVAPFVADTDFDVGTAFSSTATISTAGVNNAAPAAVYQSVRWNSSFNYTIGGLTAGTSYVVRLHFVELSFTTSGSRKFNVAINGTTVLSAFDVYAQAGQNHALEKEFNATANGSGQIVVAFSPGGADNPDVAGIEIWTQPSPPGTPTNLVASAGNGQVSMTWTGSSDAASYNVYRGTSSNGESGTPIASNVTTTNFTDATVTNGTTYYYKVAAVNSAGTSGLSNESSALPHVSIAPVPGTPTATAGFGSVSVAWGGSQGAASYNLYRATSAGGEGSTPYVSGLTATSYTDNAVTAGTTYFYKVAAVNSAGTSAQSGESNGVSPLSANGRGASMPYTRYRAADATVATTGGGATLKSSSNFDKMNLATQASGQAYVELSTSGAYVQFRVAQSNAAGVTMRFTLPDTSDGMGQSGSVDCYVNGTKVGTINLTSYYAWQYFSGGGDPSDSPNGGVPAFAFDEVHWKLPTAVNSGDTIKIQSTGGPVVGVDFLELETVPGALGQPAGSVSVTSYGASTGSSDNLAAFNSAVTAALASASKTLYIPSGTWNLGNMWVIGDPNNPISQLKIVGDGIWYTNIQFTNSGVGGGGCSLQLAANGNIDFSNMYLNSNLRSRYNENAVYKCFMDNFGVGSHIHDIWEDHFECGFWVADYHHTPCQVASNLLIENCRIRNNLADGVNFCNGTYSSTVQNCNIRNGGDDGLAVWPNNFNGAPMAVNDTFTHDTIEFEWRSAGVAIYGGSGHQITYDLIQENFMSAGFRCNTTFPGYHFENNTGIAVNNTTIVKCGTSYDSWAGELGAVDFEASNTSIQGFTFTNVDVVNAQRDGYAFGFGSGMSGLQFTNCTLTGSGLDGITTSKYTQAHLGAACEAYGAGSATFTGFSYSNAAGGGVFNTSSFVFTFN